MAGREHWDLVHAHQSVSFPPPHVQLINQGNVLREVDPFPVLKSRTEIKDFACEKVLYEKREF